MVEFVHKIFLVTTYVQMYLKLQAWRKCYTEWFNNNVDADIALHWLVII